MPVDALVASLFHDLAHLVHDYLTGIGLQHSTVATHVAVPDMHVTAAANSFSSDGGNVRVFAYGANMSSAKLNMLDIHPRDTFQAVLPGHQLIFDGHLHGEVSEPSFANVQLLSGSDDSPTAVSPVHGVVYAVSDSELKSLDQSEAPLYYRVKMPVDIQHGHAHRTIEAWTYIGTEDHPTSEAPSARYAELVLCGAKERHLPETYLSKMYGLLEHLGLHSKELSCESLQPKVSLASGLAMCAYSCTAVAVTNMASLLRAFRSANTDPQPQTFIKKDYDRRQCGSSSADIQKEPQLQTVTKKIHAWQSCENWFF